MAVSITPGVRRQVLGSQSIQTLSNSTATAAQNISITTFVSTIAGGTATGSLLRNQYLMPEGPDGLEKVVYMLATGEATLQMTMATGLHASWSMSSDAVFTAGAATGAFVLNNKGDFVRALYLDGGWTVLGMNGATFGTST